MTSSHILVQLRLSLPRVLLNLFPCLAVRETRFLSCTLINSLASLATSPGAWTTTTCLWSPEMAKTRRAAGDSSSGLAPSPCAPESCWWTTPTRSLLLITTAVSMSYRYHIDMILTVRGNRGSLLLWNILIVTKHSFFFFSCTKKI